MAGKAKGLPVPRTLEEHLEWTEDLLASAGSNIDCYSTAADRDDVDQTMLLAWTACVKHQIQWLSEVADELQSKLLDKWLEEGPLTEVRRQRLARLNDVNGNPMPDYLRRVS